MGCSTWCARQRHGPVSPVLINYLQARTNISHMYTCAEGSQEFWLGCCKDVEHHGEGTDKILGYYSLDFFLGAFVVRTTSASPFFIILVCTMCFACQVPLILFRGSEGYRLGSVRPVAGASYSQQCVRPHLGGPNIPPMPGQSPNMFCSVFDHVLTCSHPFTRSR